MQRSDQPPALVGPMHLIVINHIVKELKTYHPILPVSAAAKLSRPQASPPFRHLGLRLLLVPRVLPGDAMLCRLLPASERTSTFVASQRVSVNVLDSMQYHFVVRFISLWLACWNPEWKVLVGVVRVLLNRMVLEWSGNSWKAGAFCAARPLGGPRGRARERERVRPRDVDS